MPLWAFHVERAFSCHGVHPTRCLMRFHVGHARVDAHVGFGQPLRHLIFLRFPVVGVSDGVCNLFLCPAELRCVCCFLCVHVFACWCRRFCFLCVCVHCRRWRVLCAHCRRWRFFCVHLLMSTVGACQFWALIDGACGLFGVHWRWLHFFASVDCICVCVAVRRRRLQPVVPSSPVMAVATFCVQGSSDGVCNSLGPRVQ